MVKGMANGWGNGVLLFLGLALADEKYIENFYFGDLELRLKGKVFGSSDGVLVVSLFTSAVLPTLSIEGSKDFLPFQVGAAATIHLLGRLTVGVGMGLTWTFSMDQTDHGELNVDLYGVYRLHRHVGVLLAMQLDATVQVPDELEATLPASSFYDTSWMMTPAVQLYATQKLHLDLGCRIAVSRGGQRFQGGRFALMMALGYII